MSRGTVLVLGIKAEGAANLEVVADGVDAGVHSGKLVGGDVVSGRDGVTPIASLDGICPCTVSSKDSYTGITLSVSADEMSKTEMK